MSRIRSVHPGFFTDEDLVSVSMPARLLFIGLGVEADDKGIFEWKPLTIKMRVFPADNVAVEELLTELSGVGAVRRYEVDGRSFGAIRNFRRFQKPKTPNDIHPATAEILTFVGLPSEIKTDDEGAFPPKGETVLPKGEIPPQREEGGGNRSSVADATGAVPPSISAADVTKSVWDTGKAILKAAGHDDRQAGSIIGRFRKTYSDSQVLIVLSRCQIEQPSEPLEWLTKALQSEANNGRSQQNGHGSLRGLRPDPALDMFLQAQRDLQAEAEREGAGLDFPSWPALPPH